MIRHTLIYFLSSATYLLDDEFSPAILHGQTEQLVTI
jgi:hypothetical protein